MGNRLNAMEMIGCNICSRRIAGRICWAADSKVGYGKSDLIGKNAQLVAAIDMEK